MNNIWNEVWPQQDEYGEYYRGYINALGTGNIITILRNQMHDTHTLITSLTSEQALHRYAEGKWTVKEVIGHLIDTERVFATRCLCFCRQADANLPGFDQDEYVVNGDFDNRSLQNLAKEYHALRDSNVHLFDSFSEEMLEKKGMANGYSFTVRSIPFIIAGHERHHFNILKSRYGL